MTIIGVFLVLCILGLVYTLGCLLRNTRVYKYRIRLIEQVSVCARADIQRGQPWEWRYEAIEAVNYHEMVWKLWRSFDSFYPNKSFLLLEQEAGTSRTQLIFGCFKSSHPENRGPDAKPPHRETLT